ncbi:MAG: endonuclease III, partial [Candidatus Micrarchaeota archaeon]|nr:endonuclease III [Candidatus Micrarchaeota archaeon]
AQDKQVNKVTKGLFRAYSTPSDYAKLRPAQLYPYVKSIGLYKGKAKNIVGAAKLIVGEFGGRVPKSIEELTTLPGVGRKTANVVLSNAYGIHEGIAIDTHCITVSNRLGIARTTDPAKIERKMMPLVDRKDWRDVSHLFIALGRDVCTARAKRCERCVLNDICPSSTVRK